MDVVVLVAVIVTTAITTSAMTSVVISAINATVADDALAGGEGGRSSSISPSLPRPSIRAVGLAVLLEDS